MSKVYIHIQRGRVWVALQMVYKRDAFLNKCSVPAVLAPSRTTVQGQMSGPVLPQPVGHTTAMFPQAQPKQASVPSAAPSAMMAPSEQLPLATPHVASAPDGLLSVAAPHTEGTGIPQLGYHAHCKRYCTKKKHYCRCTKSPDKCIAGPLRVGDDLSREEANHTAGAHMGAKQTVGTGQ